MHVDPHNCVVSIDLETTGAEPDWCQVIEVGAVIYDGYSAVSSCPHFHCLVKHEQVVGQPFALQMNAVILKEIATATEDSHHLVLWPGQVIPAFLDWLDEHGIDRFTPAGKNFASFDRQFLRRLRHGDSLKMRQRALDPAALYWRPKEDGFKLPDMETCLKRAHLEPENSHRALADARDVCRLIQRAVRLNKPMGEFVVERRSPSEALAV